MEQTHEILSKMCAGLALLSLAYASFVSDSFSQLDDGLSHSIAGHEVVWGVQQQYFQDFSLLDIYGIIIAGITSR